MEKPKNVEAFIEKHAQWKAELDCLRELALSTGLDETIKWLLPVYTWNNKNIIGLGTAKNHVSVWFFQGATLKDELGVLTNAQEGKTKAMRHWKFDSLSTIPREQLLAYIEEAIQNQKDGNIIKLSKIKKTLVIPPELQKALEKNQLLQQHFDQFGLGDKRDFAEYIATAKRTATKERRLQKIIPMILRREALADKYR